MENKQITSGRKQKKKASKKKPKLPAETRNVIIPPLLGQIPIAPLYITVQSNSSTEVSLLWTKPKTLALTKRGQEQLIEYQITAMNITTEKSFAMYKYNKTSLSFPAKSGCQYYISVKAAAARSIGSPVQVPLGTVHTFHQAVFSPWEVNELLRRAIAFVQDDNPYPIAVMYRTKPSDYFWDIFHNRCGIMEVYDKDHSGDPASPINGHLQGLFFSTAANPTTGALPDVSPFGSVRLVLPIHRLVTPFHRLYFADFYCSTKKHLVTLVVTRQGTPADDFCSRKLKELPLTHGNPFFDKDAAGQFFCSKKVTVEILYTENIDVAEEVRRDFTCLRPVRPTGRGTSVPDSKPKKPSCTICNLYPDLE